MGEKEKILITLKKTRKAFWLEYACGIFLLALLGIMYLKGVKMNLRAEYFVLGLALFSIGTGEVSRIMHRYKIGETKLMIIDGLIKQNKKHVYFYSLGFVTDINVRQSRMQRLLGYGTIAVEGAGTGTFKIEDINRPHVIMEEIEKLIEKNRKIARKEKKGLYNQ